MPQLPDPARVQSRPSSVVIGELAIAAGLLGESVTIASDFPAATLCLLWRYYTHTLGPGNTIRVRAKSDIKDIEQRMTGVRAVFVDRPSWFHDVAWSIQMAGSEAMSPRPAVFGGFQIEDPDSDPGFTVPLTANEQELAAVHTWTTVQQEHLAVEVELPVAVDYAPQLDNMLQPSALERVGVGFREQQVVLALTEGAALLRSATELVDGELQVTAADYELVRRLLCSPLVRPNRELCDPLAADMMNRANVYLAVKHSGDRGNPFWRPDDDSYRQSRESSLKRDAITRRELADLGNVRSRMLQNLIEYLQRTDVGYPQYRRMGCVGEPIAEPNWRRSRPRELARRLKPWSIKQVRTRFDRLYQRGLITAERPQPNGPIHYEIPEELANIRSPYSRLPAVRQTQMRSQPVA